VLAVDLSAHIDNILRSPVEQHSLSEIRGTSQSFAKTFEFHMVNDLSFDKMLKRAPVRTP
jgi:hypothetical protein